MTRHLTTTILLMAALHLGAQEAPGDRPLFLHLGVAKADSEAQAFTVFGEAGVPVVRAGLTYLGVYAGATSWNRGAYVPSAVVAGSLLRKQAWWGGAYGGGRFWTGGLAAEYGNRTAYTLPVYADDYYTSITRNRFGAGGFIALHGGNGLGGFVRGGSQSGVGAGLSLNF